MYIEHMSGIPTVTEKGKSPEYKKNTIFNEHPVHSIREWETCQKRFYGSCSFFLELQPKNHHLYSCACVGMSKPAKKAGTGIYMHFSARKRMIYIKKSNFYDFMAM